MFRSMFRQAMPEADGKISLADVIAVIRWAAGWDVILGEAVYPAVDFELVDFSVVVPSETDNFENEAARASPARRLTASTAAADCP